MGAMTSRWYLMMYFGTWHTSCCTQSLVLNTGCMEDLQENRNKDWYSLLIFSYSLSIIDSSTLPIQPRHTLIWNTQRTPTVHEAPSN